MFQKLDEVEKRYDEITKKISDPEVIAQQSQWQTFMKEHAEIEPVVLKYREYKKAKEAMEEAKEMMEDKELKEIGPVNPNAINEYETLNERYSFMSKQIEDLVKAKEDLTKIIEQIDKTMSTQFGLAFDKIKVYFNDIFKRLFGGGNAKLILTNKEDILSSGIEIEVEPPDKKPQSLAVLSGGERTLTVIALMFAYFTYNPAPFSVLDEIDAPLDEANVKRFAKFLKDYAKRTQFILVTHRKGTMESADVMYGVTIEDAGVSKLISVRLEDFEERG